jgi:hypothetical protein
MNATNQSAVCRMTKESGQGQGRGRGESRFDITPAEGPQFQGAVHTRGGAHMAEGDHTGQPSV